MYAHVVGCELLQFYPSFRKITVKMKQARAKGKREWVNIFKSATRFIIRIAIEAFYACFTVYAR